MELWANQRKRAGSTVEFLLPESLQPAHRPATAAGGQTEAHLGSEGAGLQPALEVKSLVYWSIRAPCRCAGRADWLAQPGAKRSTSDSVRVAL